MGVEPTTSSLGSLHSTAELHPQEIPVSPEFSWNCLYSQGRLFGSILLFLAGETDYQDRNLIKQIQWHGQHQLGGDIRRGRENSGKNKN